MMRPVLQRLCGPLSSLQLRELMTRMAFDNMRLSARPTFRSQFENIYFNPDVPGQALAAGRYFMSAKLPETFALEKANMRVLGEMLGFFLKDHIRGSLRDRETALSDIKSGTHSFIFDDEMRFLINPTEDRDF